MSKIIEFKIFCLENYKFVNKLTGSEAVDLFNKYKVFDYLQSCYDVLHTLGVQYLIDDITEYIRIQRDKEM